MFCILLSRNNSQEKDNFCLWQRKFCEIKCAVQRTCDGCAWNTQLSVFDILSNSRDTSRAKNGLTCSLESTINIIAKSYDMEPLGLIRDACTFYSLLHMFTAIPLRHFLLPSLWYNGLINCQTYFYFCSSTVTMQKISEKKNNRWFLA